MTPSYQQAIPKKKKLINIKTQYLEPGKHCCTMDKPIELSASNLVRKKSKHHKSLVCYLVLSGLCTNQPEPQLPGDFSSWERLSFISVIVF